jgi:ATP-binding cassette subfamily E protein 1
MTTRIAVVDKKKCQPKKCGDECVRFCPGVRMGEETVTKDTKNQAVISEELCTGCGICVKKCPFKAIIIVNLPHELGEPLHQYGRNMFRIYNIPCPAKGIVGLVGPNGIGKTTLIKILAGELTPNLGDYKDKATWEKVLEFYKGHEIYKYLKDMPKQKFSYKPQDVTPTPDIANKKVSDVLKKLNIKKELIEKLELEKCADRKLSQISGGELQRLAIAAAISKDANFYFFDEPSSYLDVKQRLNVAKIIHELGQQKPVFVVEHDLAVLDYLTDYVYVLYGKPGAYGVVSTLKNSRVGINEFLEGFLKAENTRIRDYEIRFEAKPPASEWKGRPMYEYGDFEKNYKGFKFSVQGAQLIKGEVVGVLGPNAIGKSTYIKVLAGEEKPTKGDVDFKAKISYKPQYINFKFNGTVADFIRKQDIDSELFNAELKKIVSDLMDKNINDLSGGESQRVAIAIALARNCDILLMDEPSAFLDIEQRLHLAEVVRRITEKKEVTTLVVEHDVVFQDMVANRLMVFEGEPAKQGVAKQPVSMQKGMNQFLQEMNVTYRRDENTKRPRANKPKSQKDLDQKKKNQYYYTIS